MIKKRPSNLYSYLNSVYFYFIKMIDTNFLGFSLHKQNYKWLNTQKRPYSEIYEQLETKQLKINLVGKEIVRNYSVSHQMKCSKGWWNWMNELCFRERRLNKLFVTTDEWRFINYPFDELLYYFTKWKYTVKCYVLMISLKSTSNLNLESIMNS